MGFFLLVPLGGRADVSRSVPQMDGTECRCVCAIFKQPFCSLPSSTSTCIIVASRPYQQSYSLVSGLGRRTVVERLWQGSVAFRSQEAIWPARRLVALTLGLVVNLKINVLHLPLGSPHSDCFVLKVRLTSSNMSPSRVTLSTDCLVKIQIL